MNLKGHTSQDWTQKLWLVKDIILIKWRLNVELFADCLPTCVAKCRTRIRLAWSHHHNLPFSYRHRTSCTHHRSNKFLRPCIDSLHYSLHCIHNPLRKNGLFKKKYKKKFSMFWTIIRHKMRNLDNSMLSIYLWSCICHLLVQTVPG